MTSMVIDRKTLEEYPFDGSFFSYKVDESKPLDERTENEITVLNTKCDIQESKKSDTHGNISASFNVYFPFDKKIGISVKRGMKFRGNMYGMEINGIVIGVSPSQLGGCVCYITDVDI